MPYRLVVALCVIVGAALPVAAQPSLQVSQASRSGAFYRFADPGDVTIRVSVWGTTSTGLYEVTRGMRLRTLITLAGGPNLSPISGRSRATYRVRIMRDLGDGHEVVYESAMREEIVVPQENPVLEDDDVVVVETISHTRFNWRDAFTIVTTLSATILLIDRAARAFR